MVTMTLVLPMLLTLTLSLALCFLVLKRKSLAQSVCVQEAARLQENLRRPLRKLVRLNAQAKFLRAKRLAADRSLEAAISSAFPYAIALAKAVQTAVIAEQLVFQARQLSLLAEAHELRREGERTLHERATRIGGFAFSSQTYYHRALAVEPTPVESLSPDYQPVNFFEYAQQQRFRYQVDLLKGWPLLAEQLPWRQRSECSVSLQGEDHQWGIRILAASASPSF